MSKENAFELREFSFGAENVINIGSDTGGWLVLARQRFRNSSSRSAPTTASCPLFTMLCTGKHFKEAILVLRRSGGTSDSSGDVFIAVQLQAGDGAGNQLVGCRW